MNNIPLVYSCSGCSSPAQMAHYPAIQSDRQGIAEMSCIAGLGGNVKKRVKTTRSGSKIIAIEGCPLACTKACLSHHALQPGLEMDLSRMGVSKKQQEDFDKEQANVIPEALKKTINGEAYTHQAK